MVDESSGWTTRTQILRSSPYRLNPSTSLPCILFLIPPRSRNLQLSIIQCTYPSTYPSTSPSETPPAYFPFSPDVEITSPHPVPHGYSRTIINFTPARPMSPRVQPRRAAPHRTAPHRAAYAASQPYTWSPAPHARALPLYRRRIHTRISCLGYVRWEDTALSCVAVYGVKCMFTTVRPRGCAGAHVGAAPCRAVPRGT